MDSAEKLLNALVLQLSNNSYESICVRGLLATRTQYYCILKCSNKQSTDYWPSNTHVCGFWFLPAGWDFSCHKCSEAATLLNPKSLRAQDLLCSSHIQLQSFLMTNNLKRLVFVGLSSIGRQVLVAAMIFPYSIITKSIHLVLLSLFIGYQTRLHNLLFFRFTEILLFCSMGFLSNPRAFLMVLQTVTRMTDYRFILFTASYEPLNTAALAIAAEEPSSACQREFFEDQLLLFDGRLFCFSGSVHLVKVLHLPINNS